MKLRVLALAICIFGTISLLAQDHFDRLYRTTQRVMTGLDMAEVEGGGSYFILSKFYKERDTISGLNITSLDMKGSVSWSKDYLMYEDSLDVETIGTIQIVEDALIVNTIVKDTSTNLENVVLNFDMSGNLQWGRAYGSNPLDSLIIGPSILAKSINPDELFHIGTSFTDLGQSLYCTKIEEGGDLLWAFDLNISGSEVAEQIADIVLIYDSTYHAVGDIDNKEIFLLNHDENGTPIWSRKYFQSNLDITASAAILLPDSTFMISAYLEATNGNTMGGIIKLDTLGNIIWAKEIAQQNGLGTIYLNDIIVNDDGTIAVAGNVNLPLNASEPNSEFIINLDGDGNINWQRQFRIIAGQGPLKSGTLVSTEDTGYAYMTTAFDPDEEKDSLMLRMLKLSPTGELDFLDAGGTCHDTITLALNDITLQQDTLEWEVNAVIDTFDAVTILQSAFNHEVPTLTLPDTVFCPGDPILFPIDATTRGAVSYKWYKADDPDNIIGTDSVYVAREIDVDYVAEVKIELDNCFTLCDTTRLSDIDPPMVAIGRNNGQLCVSNQLVLFAEGSGGTLMWSTGETTSQILIDGPGNYSVVATNECDDTGEASVSISENDFLIPIEGEITSDKETCSGGVLVLTLTTTGSVASTRWNTGAISSAIPVTEAGTYTVTITDICGESIERSIEVTAGDIFGCSSGDCPEGSASADNGCLCWPNAFIPESMDEANSSFGPNDRCPNVTSYNLRIYNRWGQKVFESNNVTEEWNGRKGSKEAPSEVYAFYVVYEVEGVEVKDKGHVTLIR